MARACHDGDSGDSEGGDGEERIPTPPIDQNQLMTRTGSIAKSSYDDELTKNAINNATLPYFRNSQHKGNNNPDTNNSITNINFPKSASSWGPLHKTGHWKVNITLYGDCLYLFCMNTIKPFPYLTFYQLHFDARFNTVFSKVVFFTSKFYNTS